MQHLSLSGSFPQSVFNPRWLVALRRAWHFSVTSSGLSLHEPCGSPVAAVQHSCHEIKAKHVSHHICTISNPLIRWVLYSVWVIKWQLLSSFFILYSFRSVIFSGLMSCLTLLQLCQVIGSVHSFTLNQYIEYGCIFILIESYSILSQSTGACRSWEC